MTTTKTTMPAIDHSTHTRLKARHAVRYDSAFPNYKLNHLEVYANVSDVALKRARQDTLEGAARDMITVAERAEQDAIRADPPVNCKGYVERADYPISSLYSDYKKEIEANERTWTDYRAERKKWRKCKHMYCLNMFPIDADNFKLLPAKRKDARYCCDECRVAHKDARERFKATGSYLPVYYYLPRLSESALDDIRLHEGAATMRVIQKQKDKRRPERYAVIKREKFVGGPVFTFNSLAEAEESHAAKDRSEWVKIN